MEKLLSGPSMPRFRKGVSVAVGNEGAVLALGGRNYEFSFDLQHTHAVRQLFRDLAEGGRRPDELAARAPQIADHLPGLLEEFDRLRLVGDSAAQESRTAISGVQLYREVRRMASRVTGRVARSTFARALIEGRATREQLLGYALEYFWIVKSAPGLIGPALGWAKCEEERKVLQGFLRSELGHDRFLASALCVAGLNPADVEAHQPLPSTLALCASLGVYARQHPLSFKASLFLFERAQPKFIEAFDVRALALGLPEAFCLPLREHADLNSEYGHEDISRSLMAFERAVDAESRTIVFRHVSLMIETMIWQEEEIVSHYGEPRATVARLLN